MTKSLSKAIALATLVGVSASAHAMNVNQDGLGEVLLYSLYTSEQGNITNINITNTTDFAKAVKVRFVEGQNSKEVLDFNLYLSPRDQWSGAVTQTANGAKLITADKSCTVPAIPKGGVEFRGLEYSGKKNDLGEQSLARTRVGHLEVIEMGVLDATLTGLVSANHNVAGSAPAGCDTLTERFTANTGIWNEEKNATANLQDGFLANAEGKTGGLYGYAQILNIEESTQMSYDAVAIDNFLATEVDPALPKAPVSLHRATGSVSPSLVDGGNSFAVFKNGVSKEYGSPLEAVSALLMKKNIVNDFVLDAGRGSKTNWVVTFPTKRYHVDVASVLPPFVTKWAVPQAGKKADSCHNISIGVWDNEEYAPKGFSGVDFSPMPEESVKRYNLCYETNILTFNDNDNNDGKVLGGEFVSYNVNLSQPEYQFGWMDIGFKNHTDAANTTTAYELAPLNGVTGDVVEGLPVIGFSAMTIKNNEAENGVMNNYGSLNNHKASTTNDH